MISKKVIVTSRARLSSKYGPDGVRAIGDAIDSLIQADARRGIRTILAYLDDPADMHSFLAPAVSDPLDPQQVKEAIDGICDPVAPEYLMILGAGDVVPFQSLHNPAPRASSDPQGRGDAEDEFLSDLPYACDESFSRDAHRFVAPRRVVGRLPDLVNATQPDYLIALLCIAAKAISHRRSSYRAYFGLTAATWRGSTTLSLKAIFGDARSLRASPHEGPAWQQGTIAPRMHFINCHGRRNSSEFEGDSGYIAHSSAHICGRVTRGTVVAAECCFGAELYDPALAQGVMGICQRYLADGAYAFFGSTSIAWSETCIGTGCEPRNTAADLICQYFLQHVQNGASTGRAMLLARLQFADPRCPLSVIDLKTLAQFHLLGDPSIHPVKTLASSIFAGLARWYRRRRSDARSRALAGRVKLAIRPTEADPLSPYAEVLRQAAHDIQMEDPLILSFTATELVNNSRTLEAEDLIHIAAGKVPGHVLGWSDPGNEGANQAQVFIIGRPRGDRTLAIETLSRR